ncbi:MAG: hypothetical protein JWM47_2197 [Acidimicrobiales bacterium]|nr:hypothetical protein [Acidimicrobiales bacterium]
MSGRRLRSLLALITIGAAMAKLVQALRGHRSTSFAGLPSTTAVPQVPRISLGAALAPTTDAAELPPDGADPPIVPGTLFDDGDGPTGDDTAEAEARSWAAPVAGACPQGYPVKAKVGSGIFHEPGMSAYDRTTPDRCYPDAAAALADGLRAAKR